MTTQIGHGMLRLPHTFGIFSSNFLKWLLFQIYVKVKLDFRILNKCIEVVWAKKSQCLTCIYITLVRLSLKKIKSHGKIHRTERKMYFLIIMSNILSLLITVKFHLLIGKKLVHFKI